MQKYGLSLLAAAAVGLTASIASAADLPRKAPAYTPAPPPPPPITWTGCYIGANIGAIEGRVNTDNFSNNFFINNFDNNNSTNWGFAGGGQIGCDYQFAGTGWVVGFRDMFDGTSLRRDRNLGFINNSFGGVELHTRVNWFNTATGRIGYSFVPGWLIYGQGGGAWANAEANLTLNNFASSGQSRTRSGWTAGGGVEWMFAPHWSAFLEGNYMDLGHKNVDVFDGGNFCVGGCSFSPKFTASTVLVGVNYRWGWGKAPY